MRGSIIKRGKGYTIVYDVGLKWEEKKGGWVRAQKWEKVDDPDTRKHAETLLAERLSQVHKGEFIEPSRMIFGEFKDMWLEKYAQGQVRPSTLAQYHSLFRMHIIPAIGQMGLAAIGVEDVQGLKSAMFKGGLSPQTVKHALRLVRQMLDHAVDWEYIRKNPAKKVKDPSITRHEMSCLTPEGVRVFLDHVPKKWYSFFLTAIFSGLRIGELLAMKWGNLDWNRGQYLVKETLTRKTQTHDREFADTKTEGSAQAVDLPPVCLDSLRDHRAQQNEDKLKAGETYQEQDLIFATPTGGHLDDKNVVNRVFHPTLKVAGLRRIRFHDLRHTTASLLIAQGESPKYIQKQMRHASIEITFDRYGHLFPDANQEAAKRMEETVFGGAKERGSLANRLLTEVAKTA